MTATLVLQSLIGVVLIAGNFFFWWRVTQRWEDRFRQRCERRYGVTIRRAFKGFWEIREGGGSWIRRVGIETLQLAFFMGAMLLWSLGMLAGLGLLALVEKLLPPALGS